MKRKNEINALHARSLEDNSNLYVRGNRVLTIRVTFVPKRFAQKARRKRNRGNSLSLLRRSSQLMKPLVSREYYEILASNARATYTAPTCGVRDSKASLHYVGERLSTDQETWYLRENQRAIIAYSPDDQSNEVPRRISDVQL